jgi:hypothetical protein
VVLRYYLYSCEESRLLVSRCVDVRWDMTGSDKDLGRSKRPGADNQRWLSTDRILGGRTIERSGDTVCDLYRAQGDEEREFID